LWHIVWHKENKFYHKNEKDRMDNNTADDSGISGVIIAGKTMVA
jgi:hypothetical protein